MGRLKELDEPNRRLKKIYAEAKLRAFSFVMRWQKGIRPSQCRAMTQAAVAAQRTTIRHFCATFTLSEACDRYTSVRRPANEIIANFIPARFSVKQIAQLLRRMSHTAQATRAVIRELAIFSD